MDVDEILEAAYARLAVLYDDVPELPAFCEGGPAHGLLVTISRPLAVLMITAHRKQMTWLGTMKDVKVTAPYERVGVLESRRAWLYRIARG